jgi:Rieske Fe-S protein
MLHDVCHGSIYDFAGQHVGGPSPWSLDELVLTVKGGRVYARTDAVIPGHMTR